MEYPEEIKKLFATIPKEHHKTVRKIIDFYYILGASRVQELIKTVSELPPDDIYYYGVYHDDSIDGG